MDNIFSKTVSIIILVITLCVVPSFYLNMYYDFVNYNNRLNETYLFVDNAVLKGEILQDEKLFDSNFEVTILRLRYFPNEDCTRTISYTNASIIEDIKLNKSFKLNVGDTIIVTWSNKNINSNLFMKEIFNFKFNDIPIRIAGVVKNECI